MGVRGFSDYWTVTVQSITVVLPQTLFGLVPIRSGLITMVDVVLKTPDAANHQPQILVIDDDRTFLSIVNKALSLAGYHVTTASTGEEAVTLYQHQVFDLALLDIELPDISGIELADRLEQLPLVYITQHEDKDTVSAAIGRSEDGSLVVGYLVKPISVEKIPPLVQAALGIAKSMQTRQSVLESVMQAMEGERHQFASDIHDSVGQMLTQVRLEICNIHGELTARHIKDMADRVNVVDDMVDSIQKAIGVVIDKLDPDIFDAFGFEGTIRNLVENTRRANPDQIYSLKVSGSLDDINKLVMINIFRVLQVCIDNITKHAEANNIAISLVRVSRDPFDIVKLDITDDGIGFDMQSYIPGKGVKGMRKRILALGGRFILKSEIGQGTVLSISIPLLIGDI